MQSTAKFSVGQLVQHKLFNYRGVIFDVDARFQLSDEWYEAMARSRPPKDQPWYRVLVHDATYDTYVAERNLEQDLSGKEINHPGVEDWFGEFVSGCYRPAAPAN